MTHRLDTKWYLEIRMTLFYNSPYIFGWRIPFVLQGFWKIIAKCFWYLYNIVIQYSYKFSHPFVRKLNFAILH